VQTHPGNCGASFCTGSESSRANPDAAQSRFDTPRIHRVCQTQTTHGAILPFAATRTTGMASYAA
jgi:hypothetical protein